LKPLTEVTVIVDDPPAPWVTDIDVGFAMIEKSGVTVIVNPSVCECIKLPLVPVIVIDVTRGSVPGSTFTVAMDVVVPPAGGVTAGGEKPTWTPAGRALVLRVTAELNDDIDVIVTVSLAAPPEPMLKVGEVSDSEKSAPDVTVSMKDAV
jgi:hypothetical protein